MKLVINGVEIPVTDKLDIQIQTDPAGERLVPVYITNTGGLLSCYASSLQKSGPIATHVFGDEK